MENILEIAIQSVQRSEIAFSKFITANDTGASGAHQSGFYVHKGAWRLFFDTPGEKGSNKDKHISIRWQNTFETKSRAIYYGQKSRNEYRLTRFGRNFPFFEDDNIGDLLILTKLSSDQYEGYILQSDEDIDDFFAAFNISSSDTNGIIPKQFEITAENKLTTCFESFILSLKTDFPNTIDLSNNARVCYNASYGITENHVLKNPDNELLQWIKAEFQLFKAIEENRYEHLIQSKFSSVEDLIITANSILNRRKSRAGKSLENHLSEIFNIHKLSYSSQMVTEGNKKPDFLFPAQAYHDNTIDRKKLIMLASKTTCKDRWRQILTEANKIEAKHLFTLQQGISENQLKEMYKEKVTLVVPDKYINFFPNSFKEKIMTLRSFIKVVERTQNA